MVCRQRSTVLPACLYLHGRPTEDRLEALSYLGNSPSNHRPSPCISVSILTVFFIFENSLADPFSDGHRIFQRKVAKVAKMQLFAIEDIAFFS